MKKKFRPGLFAASMLLFAWSTVAAGEDAAEPAEAAAGVVRVPAFDLPPSDFMSKEAIAMMSALSGAAPARNQPGGTIEDLRTAMENHLQPVVRAMLARYPVNVVESRIAGVPTRIFTPKEGPADQERILINLHGGAFQMCAIACAFLESAPVAALGGFKVVSVDYRQGPEAVFPAASEDVAKVYKALIEDHDPGKVGIYGCSAGGALAAQATAWIGRNGLPTPGAIGIFGAGAVRGKSGDSRHVAPRLTGSAPGEMLAGGAGRPAIRSYFEGADDNDPLVSPGDHLELLAKFPPTLVITGTRATDLSPAVYTHSQLVKAGVPASLMVGEGMPHCYIYFSQLPEARDAHNAIVNFFRANLE